MKMKSDPLSAWWQQDVDRLIANLEDDIRREEAVKLQTEFAALLPYDHALDIQSVTAEKRQLSLKL